MKTHFVKLVPCVALSLFAAACVLPDGEALDIEAVDSEEVDEAVSALCTDPGAADYSKPLTYNLINNPYYSAGVVSSMSPTGTYGSAACNGRYVVEATNVHDKTIAIASAGGNYIGVSEGACSEVRVYMQVFAYNMWTYSWDEIGFETTASGVWGAWDNAHPESFSCKVKTTVVMTDTFAKYAVVRVAARVQFFAVFTNVTGQIFTFQYH
jgi:hypothetical protein